MCLFAITKIANTFFMFYISAILPFMKKYPPILFLSIPILFLLLTYSPRIGTDQPALAQESRDPLTWPFDAASIWNMPIGSDAVYVPAEIAQSTQRGMTVDGDILILEPDAPLTPMYENFVAWNSSSEGARCGSQGELLDMLPIPADFVLGQPEGTTENNAAAILMPDGRTLKQNQPFTRCAAGGHATSLYEYEDVDIYGMGLEGAHGGSGLSSIGGTIRLGELVPGGQIRHALKINLYSGKNYYFNSENEVDGQPGFRWPARWADNVAAQTYQGTNPVLQMGALLAIHRDVDLPNNELALETEPARMLAQALQDYGGYVVDDAAWNVYAIATEVSPNGTVTDEFEAAWGFALDIAEKDTPWGRDMDRIFGNLYVIDNNGPDAVGGGGSPRVALAPPFGTTDEPPNTMETTLTYAEDSADFPNPERGFHDNMDILNETELGWIRDRGYTLARTSVRLDEYRDGPIPQDLLDDLVRGLDAARAAGIKVILRFAYNFPGEDYENAQDASVEQVLTHLAQLTPVFDAHSDVIVTHQAGFVGAWGEWHSSSNDLTSLENRAVILNALLDAIPPERSVQLRYPGHLIDAYPTTLKVTDGYGTSNQARTGHHNDCFLANESDAGTYWPPEREEEFRTYLDGLTPWVAVGGETCQVTPDQQRTDCPTTLAELERFHYSYMNAFFYDGALDRWRTEGCYEEISKRLGYRYRLIEGTAPTRATAGKPMSLTLTFTNDGWAGIFNPRSAAFVLRNQESGAETKIRLTPGDPRRWLPQPGLTRTLTFTLNMPTSAMGDYDLLLDLPDAAPSLADNPAYSIRLANQLNSQSVWEADTGYNTLGLTVQVNAAQVDLTATPVTTMPVTTTPVTTTPVTTMQATAPIISTTPTPIATTPMATTPIATTPAATTMPTVKPSVSPTAISTTIPTTVVEEMPLYLPMLVR